MVSVLVVEDDAAIRTGLVRGLGQRGMAVLSTGAGLSALELVVKDRPDVLLLDLGLPDIDGCRLLAMLRAVSEVPVIVVTAQDDESIVRRWTQAPTTTWSSHSGSNTWRHGSARCCGEAAPRAGRALRRRRAGGRSPRPHGRPGGKPLELSRKEFDLLLALADV